MFTRGDDYYQIMDKAFLNIDPTTGLPTPHGKNKQVNVLKSTNKPNPSTVEVDFRSAEAIDPVIFDDGGKNIYVENNAIRPADLRFDIGVWVEKEVPIPITIPLMPE
jgi:hypothetical protein